MPEDFLAALEALTQEKGLPSDSLQAVVEHALAVAYKRAFRTPGLVTVALEPDGSMRIDALVEVADPVTDEYSQVSLDVARLTHPDAGAGEYIHIDLPPGEFARLAAQTAKQAVSHELREAEREKLLHDVGEHQGEVVDGLVRKHERDTIYLDLGKLEGVLPADEQIPGERYRMDQHLKVLLLEPMRRSRNPQVLVSRAHRSFVKRLLEFEVPEFAKEIITLRAIAREPGTRTKLAVSTTQAGLDPVGACVGPKGARIRAVVNELNNERVDVILWSDDPAELVASALNPAQISSVKLNRDTKTAEARVPADQLSLAIGRDGQNARLAAKLTGWRIDIKAEEGGAPASAQNSEPTTDQSPIEEIAPVV